MRPTLATRFRVLSVVVFLLGLVTAILAYSINQSKKPKPPLALTMISRQTVTLDGEAPQAGFNESRYQRSDGSWKQIRSYTSPDGKVKKEDTGFGLIGRGVFQVDNRHRILYFISPMPSDPSYRAGDLRRDEHYVRDDSVLSYETRVLRFNTDDGSGYTENYYAPALQDLLIKSVSVSKNRMSVTEPVQIQLSEPSEDEFSSLPDWRIRYDRFEEKIESMESAGQPDAADQMRQVLEQERQKHPDR
jgi:hypothetical protein